MLELKQHEHHRARGPQISPALHLSLFIPFLTAAPRERIRHAGEELLIINWWKTFKSSNCSSSLRSCRASNNEMIMYMNPCEPRAPALL